jgi:uncharacterized membrane protein
MVKTKSFRFCGWGLLVSLLSIVLPPFTTFIFPIISMILILIGYKGISDEFGDVRIWRNIVLSIVFYALSFLVLLVLVWYFITFLWNVFNNYFYYFEELFSEEGFNEFLRYISFRALVFAILFYAFLVLSSFFFYRANKLIGDVTGNNNFRVGGLLVFVSTILFPIIIGIIIYPVGLIILIVAFFGKYENIKDKKEGDDIIIKL